MPSVTRNELPDVDFLLQILAYNPETGLLTNLDRPSELFSSERAAKSWRTQYLGKTAGSLIAHGGNTYCQVEIFNIKYVAHRIIWKMYYREDPPETLDHIDGDGTNNRISNLRKASVAQNAWNCGKSSRNKSGYKGVSFNSEKKKWRAAIRCNKKDVLIGYYATPESASEAYQKYSISQRGEFHRHK